MNELKNVRNLASLVSEQQHRNNEAEEEQQNDVVAAGARRRRASVPVGANGVADGKVWRRRRGNAVGEEGVVEEGRDSVDSEGRGGEEVGVGEGDVVEGEVVGE